MSIVLVLVAFLGSAHVLIRTAIYGIGSSGDAGTYMEYAESLTVGDGFRGKLITSEQVFDTEDFRLLTGGSYRGQLTGWPPLFSVILAFFRMFGVELVETGRYLNAISFGFIILIAGHWLHRYVRFRLVVVGASVAVMVSYPLLRVSSQVLTEMVFILVTLLALVQMESFLSGRTAKTGFLLSIVFSAMAPLTRWIGITVILTGILLILTRQETPAHVRLRRAAFYGALSSLPLALWLTRNWIVSGTLTGSYAPESVQSHWDTLSQFGDILYTWLFVGQEPGWLGICLWAVTALIVLEASKLFTRRTTAVAPQTDRNVRQLTLWPVFPFAAYAILYSIVLIVLVQYRVGDAIINRYVAPVYVPAIIPAAVWLDRFLLAVYQSSGVSVWKNLDGWGIRYDKLQGPVAVTKWLLIGLILNIFLVNSIRNIVQYIDVLIIYDPLQYLF